MTHSKSAELDTGNWKKILKGFLINLSGAVIIALTIQVFPQVLEWAKSCVGDNMTCNGLSPRTAQFLVFLVPFGASLVNTFKEWLTDYSK
jgi:hypothetical protein